MKKLLENAVPFPVDAESDNFTAALASALVLARGYTAGTPYWCAEKRRRCVHCSPCGERILERHQLSVYHCLLTASTLAFGFDYPWDDSVSPHTLPGFADGWRWDGDFVDALARFAGFAFCRFGGKSPRGAVSAAVKDALDAGFPTLLRLEDGPVWRLAVGYEGETVLALDRRPGALPAGWQETLRDAVVLTGNTAPAMSCREFLGRIAAALSFEEHAATERMILRALDGVTPENALETAGMLCAVASVPVEARWHAALAFAGEENLLCAVCTDEALRRRLRDVFFARYLCEGQGETHGVCWQIWGALGVGPKTGYNITPQSAPLLLQRETREALRRLFARVFENDRAVCAAVQAELARL